MTTPALPDFHSGYISLIGRPNVGKSTLMNALIGQKISIICHKPQTTRHRIMGIKTTDATQMVFIDTPGLHNTQGKQFNRYLNRAATLSLQDVDTVIWLVEALKFTEEDASIAALINQTQNHVVIAVNKIDRVKDKTRLLPFIADLSTKLTVPNTPEIIPISATTESGLDTLETILLKQLPPNEPIFPEDSITDRSIRFMVGEMIREKIMMRLNQEIPYGTSVEISAFEEQAGTTHIHATIYTEKSSHKSIVIGRQGECLKWIGSQARKDMEALLESKVFLKLWVKVREHWQDDEAAIRSLGYE